MRIGIIGAGNMGGPLGVTWAKAGHQVLWATRNPAELMPLVQQAAPRASAGYAPAAAFFGDVIVLAVPPSAVPQLGKDIGELLRGKIVIDMTNPRADRDGEEQTAQWLAMGSGQAMAQYLPGARVVKAFNTLGARMLAEPAPNGVRIAVPIAGDNADDREQVARLVREAGFEPVIVGPLARAKEFDRGTPVWVTGMNAQQVREALGVR
jgi:predicted dinucleotide-binding enzyme